MSTIHRFLIAVLVPLTVAQRENYCSSPDLVAWTLKSWYLGHTNGGGGKWFVCEDLCREDPKCNSWMGRNSGNTCYLSEDSELRVRPSGCCSDHHPHTFNAGNCDDKRSKLCSSPDQTTMTLKSWYFGHENGGGGKWAQCEQLCRDDPKCNSWMGRNSGNTCYLSEDRGLKVRPSSCCSDHHPHTLNADNCVDECADPVQYPCPANSQCADKNTGYDCVCEDGFFLKDQYPSKVGNPGSTCVPAVISVSVFPASTSAFSSMTTQDDEIDTFKVVVNLVDKYRQKYPIDEYTGITSNHNLIALQPGTNYTIDVLGINSFGNLVGVGEDYGVAFATTCNCEGNPDPSGKPMDLELFQDKGFVTFAFSDASMCESAYSFSRQAMWELEGGETRLSVKEIFTQDYFYFSKDPCSEELYRPGKRSADDLYESQLTVGNKYRYCVRAVGPNSYSSEETCLDHVIDWEASVTGLVRLKEAAGSLPVADVAVSYLFNTGDFPISGTVSTGEDGRFHIPIKAVEEDGNRPNPPMENNKPYLMTLSFSKITEGENGDFDHSFLCEGGAVPCERSDSSVYLTHLGFDTPIEIIDDSTVPITGKVLIDKTFCGIHNAEVCIVDHLARTTGERENCVETNPDGSFEIGAVIGTRITVEVNYFNHTFELSHPTLKSDNENEGFVIDATKFYEGLIFRDKQRHTLKVDVYGGECRRFLGASQVVYSIKGCSELDPDASFGDVEIDFDQGTFTAEHDLLYGEYLVPAHELEVAATVYDTVNLAMQSIDMREPPQGAASGDDGMALPADHGGMVGKDIDEEEKEILDEEEAKDAEKSDPYLLMFQFDGTVALDVQLSNNPTVKCTEEEFATSDRPRFKLPAFRLTDVTVLITETFPHRKDGTAVESCDVFEDGLQVFLRNQLGYMGTDDDDKYLETLTDVDKALLTGCSDGCFIDIEYDHDTITKEKSRAHLEKRVMVGPPFFDANADTQDEFSYLRKLTAEVVRGGALTSLTVDALVVGDMDQGFIDKIGLPTHEPLLVLRDPPGGLSKATYQNVESTVFVKMDSFERKTKPGAWFDLRTSVDTKSELCAGGGFGAIILNCDWLGAEGLGTIQSETNADFTVEHDVDTWTASFTTTWSYATSSDPMVAGQASDIFVVPTLNINFYIVHQVEDDDDNCVGEFRETVKFDVGENENQAVSFYTHRDIVDFELPDYRERLAQLQEQTSNTDCNSTTLIQEKKFACEATKQTEKAIKSWERFINEYENTNAAALNGTYGNEVQKINEWFDYTVDHSSRGWLDGSNVYDEAGVSKDESRRQSSSLIPGSLQESAQLVKEGRVEGAAENLEKIQYISFSGGGSSFSFLLNENKDKSQERLTGGAGENSHVSFDLSASYMIDAHFFALGFRTDVGPKFHTDAIRVTHHTDIHSRGSTVGFTLGDNDVGDMFDIKVSLDKKYGTFIFTSLPTSRSKCPHEAGTVKRVDPFIRVVEPYPPPLVLPDEPMLFKLELSNLGEDRSNFELFSDKRDNENYLNHPFSQFPKSIDYIDGGETMTITVPITRGPVEYRYPPVPITLRCPCEFVNGDGNMFGIPNDERTQFTVELYNNKEEGTIEFAEPCPDVTMVKPSTFQPYVVTAEQDDSHLINVVVRNPAVSLLGKFIEQTSGDTRLERVRLKYLDKARHRVSVASVLMEADGENVSSDIDFAAEMGNEDQLGFSSIQWDIEIDSLADGEYEFWVETVCEEFPGAHPSFNSMQSDHVQLVVDRKRPKLFGLPKPATGEIAPGTEVVFEFTEDLDCENRFELAIEVEGLDRIFDNKVDGSDNLLVICEGRAIGFHFDITNTQLDDLLGKPFHMELSGVADLAGNKMEGDKVEHNLQFAEGDVRKLVAHFDLSLDRECSSKSTDMEASKHDVAVLLDLSEDEIDRMHVDTTCASDGSQILAHVELSPPSEGSERRLGSHGEKSRSSTGIFYDALHIPGGRSLNGRSIGVTLSNLEAAPPVERAPTMRAQAKSQHSSHSPLIAENLRVEKEVTIQDLKDVIIGAAVAISCTLVAGFAGVALLLLRTGRRKVLDT